MEIIEQKIVSRWNNVVESIGCEHLAIGTSLSELETHKSYYGIEHGVTVGWMLKEANYWLLCYYESGHCRCDDRFLSREDYAIWRSETGKLKRLINKLEKMSSDTWVAK